MAGRTFLGRYDVIKPLGEGGMGKVYLAKQSDLGRQVVVKVMHEHVANDPKFRERFQREMLLMARLQHPYIVSLYEASLNDPQGPCIVMEYVRGISLDTLLHRTGRMTAPRAGRLIGQLCEALFSAQQEGVIHRDLKPANLMVVDPDTPYEKIKVMDFGLAKLVDSGTGLGMMHKQSQTGLDFAVGTPGYISPEQVRGEETDHRCDIYSIGVITYELLTGRLPFIRDETMDVLFAHATEPPPTFAEAGAANWVSEEIEAIVMRALAKTPAERPGSAREFAEDFQRALLDAERQRTDGDSKSDPAAEADETGILAPVAFGPAPKPVVGPGVVVHEIEAWMPDAIATYKLRGFVQDNNGEVIESVPGVIKMRIGGTAGTGAFSWLGLGRKSTVVDIELHLHRDNASQPNLLHVTVLMSSPHKKSEDAHWRERCGQVFCELRSYLAAVVVSS